MPVVDIANQSIVCFQPQCRSTLRCVAGSCLQKALSLRVGKRLRPPHSRRRKPVQMRGPQCVEQACRPARDQPLGRAGADEADADRRRDRTGRGPACPRQVPSSLVRRTTRPVRFGARMPGSGRNRVHGQILPRPRVPIKRGNSATPTRSTKSGARGTESGSGSPGSARGGNPVVRTMAPS